MLYFQAPGTAPQDLDRAREAVNAFFRTKDADPIQCALCAASFDAQCSWGMWNFHREEDAPAETWEFIPLNAEQLRLKDIWLGADAVFLEVAYRGKPPPDDARLLADIPLPLLGVRDSRYNSLPSASEIAQRQADSAALDLRFPDSTSAEAVRAREALGAKWDAADRERIERLKLDKPLPPEFFRGPGPWHWG